MILSGDCLKLFENIEPLSIDLIFADPPFNIDYAYDKYDDNKSSQEYLNWCKKWIKYIYQSLKPNGSFWLAIGDEYAAELKIISQECDFHCSNWIIWFYSFGVACTKKFARSHTHLFHFVKDKNNFKFNDEKIRMPSARQLIYKDKRANSKGKIPDNTWTLKPEDNPDNDLWSVSRVCGTFKERQKWHPCQMPEKILERIILVSSNENDLVLDPFAGSGTTLVVAKKLNRKYIGFEISENYVEKIKERLNVSC